MLEAELVSAIIDMARMFGVTAAHFRPARVADKGGKVRMITAVQGDGKGFPDLVLVGLRVAYREVKVGRNTLSPEQVVWIGVLKAAGADAAMWHEDDWHSGRIENELRSLAGMPLRKVAPQTDRKPPAWLRNGGRHA